jgi:hypothetical protein
MPGGQPVGYGMAGTLNQLSHVIREAKPPDDRDVGEVPMRPFHRIGASHFFG